MMAHQCWMMRCRALLMENFAKISMDENNLTDEPTENKYPKFSTEEIENLKLK